MVRKKDLHHLDSSGALFWSWVVLIFVWKSGLAAKLIWNLIFLPSSSSFTTFKQNFAVLSHKNDKAERLRLYFAFMVILIASIPFIILPL